MIRPLSVSEVMRGPDALGFYEDGSGEVGLGEVGAGREQRENPNWVMVRLSSEMVSVGARSISGPVRTTH